MLDKDMWSLLIEATTLAGGAIAVFLALRQYADANRTRKEDLRWRQAERADDLLDQILNNPRVVNAFLLLDWDGAKKFPFVNGDQAETITATWQEQDHDLANASGTIREMLVRESFDALHEAFERLEHAISIGAVVFSDVARPFHYYVKKIEQRKTAFAAFHERWGYDMAKCFLHRYRLLAP